MIRFLLILELSIFISSCSHSNSQESNQPSQISKLSLINPLGNNINSRFEVPEGFKREMYSPNSFENYLQNLSLKKDGSMVHLYNGTIKENRGNYLAVVDLPIGKKDLHQCADAVMRLRAEYLFSFKKYNQISFLTASGKNLNYSYWLNGRNPNKTNFWEFLEELFNVANTTSLNKQLKSKPIEQLEIGDVFIFPWQGRFYGHAIIVVDKCKNSQGKVKFMLAQSYTPAQDIEILDNPNEIGSPWYDLDFGETLDTPQIDFSKNQLKRF